jgi:hypothetical protein
MAGFEQKVHWNGQRDGVDVAPPGREAGVDHPIALAKRDTLHLAERPAGRPRPQQLDEGVLALAQDDHVEGAGHQHVVGDRGAVLATQHEEHARGLLAHGVGHPVHDRPQRAEHAGDPDHLGRRIDPADDLVDGEPLDHEVGAVGIG